MIERYKGVAAYIRTILSIWFFVGMPLSMLLSSLYSFFGVSPPPLLLFLASMTYLSRSVLGGLWGRESLQKNRGSRIDIIGPLFVLMGSVVFLCIGIVFAIVAFKRF